MYAGRVYIGMLFMSRVYLGYFLAFKYLMASAIFKKHGKRLKTGNGNRILAFKDVVFHGVPSWLTVGLVRGRQTRTACRPAGSVRAAYDARTAGWAIAASQDAAGIGADTCRSRTTPWGVT
jgi:hypothetical protein